MISVCLGLLALNLFQAWWYSRETHRLIDKVMSKSYSEYVSSAKYLEPSSPRPISTEPDIDSRQEEEVLGELNRMLSS